MACSAIRRQRAPPSANRSATDSRRRSDRARNRFAAFATAMTSTSSDTAPTSPASPIRPGPASPTGAVSGTSSIRAS